MNIVPRSVPTERPSDAAPVSADTMMNSSQAGPHTEKESVFLSGHFTARREGPFHTPAEVDVTVPYGAAAIKHYIMLQCLSFPVLHIFILVNYS